MKKMREVRTRRGRRLPAKTTIVRMDGSQDRTETTHYERGGKKMIRQLTVHRGMDRAVYRAERRRKMQRHLGRYVWP